jgi:hypothetical protein
MQLRLMTANYRAVTAWLPGQFAKFMFYRELELYRQSATMAKNTKIARTTLTWGYSRTSAR